MIKVFYILSVIFLFVLFNNPILFSLMLVFFSLISMYILVFYNICSGLVAFMILMIYLGAMMVLFGYVCAVVPNINYLYSWNSLLTFFSTLFIYIMFVYMTSGSTVFHPDTNILNMTSFFYSPVGLVCFLIIILLMLVILYSCTVMARVSSPLRSSWKSSMNYITNGCDPLDV